MTTRQIASILQQRLSSGVRAAVLLGPRQVRKTTLARQLATHWPQVAVYLDLELPYDRRRLEDPETCLRAVAPKLVVIDVIHRVPELFAVLRGLIDERRAAGQRYGLFLLLSSAAMEQMQQSSETLAGRVAHLDKHATNLREAISTGLSESVLWNRGGFPDSLLAQDAAHSMACRQDFIRSYLERDMPMFALRMPAETLGRLWTMLAHQESGQINQAQLGASLGVSALSVDHYLHLLTDLHLVRRRQPWLANEGKRLVKTPKVLLRDSGLGHALLGLKNENDVLGHPVAGARYQGFVLETTITQADPSLKPISIERTMVHILTCFLNAAGNPISRLRSNGPVRHPPSGGSNTRVTIWASANASCLPGYRKFQHATRRKGHWLARHARIAEP